MTPDELDAFWANWHVWWRTQPESSSPLLTDDDREHMRVDEPFDDQGGQDQWERHLDRMGGSR